jgi:integrative and conjugative element protein (TIGR02256 family)
MNRAWVEKISLARMIEEASNKYPDETGGCLMGYGSQGNVVVTTCIGPGPKAKHRRSEFVPDSEWQELQIEQIYEKSGRLLTYLGDWHSHPNAATRLSWKDRRTLLKIATFGEARLSSPIMAVVAGPPWSVKVWKTVSPRRIFFNVCVEELTLIVSDEFQQYSWTNRL